MVEKITKEIFLPITFKTYKQNKINLLKTQLKTVNTLDRIKRLEALRKLKAEQRKLLKTIIKEIKGHHIKLIKSLPKIEKTRPPQPTYTPTKTYTAPIQIEYQPNSRIDDELDKIQEKLRNLKL